MEVLKLYNEKDDLNLKATELRLGLPGTEDVPPPEKQQSVVKSNKRSSTDDNKLADKECALPPKAQVIGWPPVRSYRKNAFQQQKKQQESSEEAVSGGGIYVKVSMDGAPFLRKIDLKLYKTYNELVKGLQTMFKCTILGDYCEKDESATANYNNNNICNNGSDYALTYEDKDGDWMLVGDVPWDMFLTSCKRMRIMKGSDANGL